MGILGKKQNKNKQPKKNQKSKTKLSTPTINVPLFAFVVTLMNQANNSFKTKLNSFILQTCAVYEAGSASNYHQLHLHQMG